MSPRPEWLFWILYEQFSNMNAIWIHTGLMYTSRRMVFKIVPLGSYFWKRKNIFRIRMPFEIVQDSYTNLVQAISRIGPYSETFSFLGTPAYLHCLNFISDVVFMPLLISLLLFPYILAFIRTSILFELSLLSNV